MRFVIGPNVWLTQSVAPDTVVLEKPALRLKGGSKAATEAFMYHI